MTDTGRSRAHWALFGLGLAISLLMLARVQVAGDGISLLSRGWLLAAKHIWVPLGNPVASSAGGYVPGGLTALVVGLPLQLWMHPRAPVVLILLCHVLAYLMIDRVVGEALGRRARLVFAVVYWLNPWRLYQSAWLDNSNYVFLTGALHLWACYRQRHTPSFLHSALLVGGVGPLVLRHPFTLVNDDVDGLVCAGQVGHRHQSPGARGVVSDRGVERRVGHLGIQLGRCEEVV